MLEHLNACDKIPQKIVVMGSSGFIGSQVVKEFARENTCLIGLSSKSIDLTSEHAAERLAQELGPEVVLIVTSAKAPCKSSAMLIENLQMIKAVCEAIEKRPPAHTVYISSDAVYADSMTPLTEESPKGADNLHSMMHATREVMLLQVSVSAPLAILRPTLVYGAGDPHNGYGPNSFRRRAAEKKDIVLFGEGEERRDHIYVDDVAKLVVRIVKRQSRGTLNAATGVVTSFRCIAEQIAGMSSSKILIKGSPRKGAMPHNGYRAFDVAACHNAFPDFQFTELTEGLERASASESKVSG